VLRTLRDDDRGQGLAEYGLILGFVAVLCVAAVAFFGSQLGAAYQHISANYP
jgi:Flp pilus assembly pilin Flp